MNEETKYKLVFGEQVAKKEYLNLQNESRPLKPASLNKLLAKRNWKLDQIPDPHPKSTDTKITKLKPDFSLNGEIEQRGVFTQEEHQSQTKDLSNQKEENGEYESPHSRFYKQLKIGRLDLNKLLDADNLENYLAYHLSKFEKQNYLT